MKYLKFGAGSDWVLHFVTRYLSRRVFLGDLIYLKSFGMLASCRYTSKAINVFARYILFFYKFILSNYLLSPCDLNF